MKHNPRCPFCGAPTRAQPFRDRTAWQCTECASLCVGPEVATELLLVMTGTPAGAPPRRAPGPRTRSMPLATLGLALVFLLLAVPVAVAIFGVVHGPSGPRVSELPPVVVTLPPPAPIVAPPPNPPPPAEPPPAPEGSAAPAPAPEAPPEGGPAPASARTAKAAIEQGWKRLDRDAHSAEASFREALDREPGNPEAQYGLGYSLLQQGDRSGATRWLCASRSTAGRDMRREVESLLEHHGLTCP